MGIFSSIYRIIITIILTIGVFTAPDLKVKALMIIFYLWEVDRWTKADKKKQEEEQVKRMNELETSAKADADKPVGK